ncbi:mCG145161, partial [Mus musculus]
LSTFHCPVRTLVIAHRIVQAEEGGLAAQRSEKVAVAEKARSLTTARAKPQQDSPGHLTQPRESVRWGRLTLPRVEESVCGLLSFKHNHGSRRAPGCPLFTVCFKASLIHKAVCG